MRPIIQFNIYNFAIFVSLTWLIDKVQNPLGHPLSEMYPSCPILLKHVNVWKYNTVGCLTVNKSP